MPDPFIVPLECGCFFRGRKFFTASICEEHAEDDESYRSLKAIEARHKLKYEHLTLEERSALIEREQAEGLAKIKELGIKPSMTAEELNQLTRGED